MGQIGEIGTPVEQISTKFFTKRPYAWAETSQLRPHIQWALPHIPVRDYDQVRVRDIERRTILREVHLHDIVLAGF